MASIIDKQITGPVPIPKGTWTVTLHVRHSDHAARHGYGTCLFEGVNAEILYATSRLLWEKLLKKGDVRNVYIVWKEFETVETYLQWLHDKIIRRGPSEEVPNRWYNTTLKYPTNPMQEYSPMVRDMHMLINLWLFGCYVEDETFMDTVMSTLQVLFEEAHEDEYADGHSPGDTFLRLLKPSVVEAIWIGTASGAKLRAFVVDAILQYGSHSNLMHFNTAELESKKLALESPVTPSRSRRSTSAQAAVRPEFSSIEAPGESAAVASKAYPGEFLKELNHVHRGTVLVSQLPTEYQALYPGLVRVFLPPPYYSLELIGRQLFEEEQHSPYPPFDTIVLRQPQAAVSLAELVGDERLTFFTKVYGEGKFVPRPPFWNLEGKDKSKGSAGSEAGNDDLGNVDASSSGVDGHHVKTSCLYHEHKDDAACWCTGPFLHRGGLLLPVPAVTSLYNV